MPEHLDAAKRGLSLVVDATRRGGRRVLGALRSKRTRVVFHPGYETPASEIADHHRARKIVGYLEAEGWLSARQLLRPQPATIRELLRVHDADYLASLDRPGGMARVFGLETLSRSAAAGFLEAQRWATGGTVAAAKLARKLRGRGGVVVNLGGGFHHAHREHGAGFCALNDVAVAIAALRAEGFSGRVLVVDLDVHHGDGTRRIFAEDDRVVTCSIHATSWDERPARRSIDVALGLAVGDDPYLEAVARTIPEAFDLADPELLFYVAGVDVAEDDRLGSWMVSPEAVLRRDRLVIEQRPRVPTVMVLAGGYGEEAWRHTARTLVWLVSGKDAPVLGSVERSLARFRRIKESISPAQLTGDPFELTEADLMGDLEEGMGEHRILGFYTPYGIEVALERYGLLEHLRTRGYDQVAIECARATDFGDRIRVSSGDAERFLLIELVVKIVRDVADLALLDIEWLLLQDPRREPTKERPLLPGQEHPGLGCLALIVGMLMMACERLGLDGLLFTPSHYHVAAQARGLLRFLAPEDEAFFVALGEVTRPLPLHRATQLVADGAIVDDATNEPLTWRPARMCYAVSDTMKRALADPAYERTVRERVAELHFRRADATTA